MHDKGRKCLRLIVALLQLTCAIVSLFAIPWVVTDLASWTLWDVCFNDASDVNGTYLGLELEDDGCAELGNTVPEYYKAIRGLAILLFILYTLQVNVLCDNVWFDKGKRPAFMALLSASIAAAAVGVGADNVVDDDHWQGEGRELDTGFYFVVFNLAVSVIMIFAHYRHDELRVTEALKSKAEDEAKNKSAEESNGATKLPRRGTAARSTNSAGSPAKNAVVPARILASASNSDDHDQRQRFLGELRGQFRPRAPEVSQLHGPPSPCPSPLPPAARVESSDFLSDSSSSSSSEGSVSLPASPTFDSYAPVSSFGDHSRMHDVDHVSMDKLYCEDLRSASRASYLHDQRQEMDQDVHGELPLLESMPAYTMPPSRNIQIPTQAPPSYEAAMRKEYWDMPPPPVVTVPFSHFTNDRR